MTKTAKQSFSKYRNWRALLVAVEARIERGLNWNAAQLTNYDLCQAIEVVVELRKRGMRCR